MLVQFQFYELYRKIAILNLKILWSNSKVNAIWIKLLNNQKSCIEITVTICYKFTSVTICYKFYMNGSQILYRNTNVENIEPPSHIEL